MHDAGFGGGDAVRSDMEQSIRGKLEQSLCGSTNIDFLFVVVCGEGKC